ncbi:MAG: hypothetical protein JWO06_905, partial [Bacteroidota bacterium]|nr:hypothetical protein [Bacteroidota bacterium]
FHYQHGVNILNDGTIALFNNGDTAIKTGFSKVVNFSQPSATDKEGKILWEYECNFDSSNVWKSARGGNVDELNNHNYLVCMGAITRVFEITKSKEIVWNAIAEQNAGDGHGWVQKPIYRAHYTSSLYTCYFTAQCNIDTLSRLSPAFKLKIYNEGTDGDSYSISVTTASKSFGEKNQSVIVEGGKSVTFGFAPLKNSVKAEKVEVVIMSNTNPDLKRKISLQWVVK